MRRSTLVLGLLGCIALGVGFVAYRKATEHSRAWREFNNWERKDLGAINESEQIRFENNLTTLIPGRKSPRTDLDFRPRAVWRLQASNYPDRVLFFEVDDSHPHPGSTLIRLTTFSENAQVLSMSEFATGYRTYMSGFELKTLRVSRYPTLHVLTGLGSRQVYALVADQWLLIRVEEDGQAISDPNSVFRCGPELRPESIEIVLQALNSSDPSEVLAMLCWLGGFTREVSNPRNKAASTAAFYSEALRNPFVSKRLEELKESQDRWTRDGAALVLKR